MGMMKRKILLFALCLCIISPHLFALEQADCFDYYKFPSVNVEMEPQNDSVDAGSKMVFLGKIMNENTYPVVDGKLYAKISMVEGDANSDVNGTTIVDQFIALEGISIDSNSAKDITFDWPVPTGTQSGEYHMEAFFVSGKKFNLTGLSYTDANWGKTADFKVRGAGLGTIGFLKNSVKVNHEDYYFSALIPEFGADDPITIETELANSTGSYGEAEITWKLYKWSHTDEQNLIGEKTESLTLEPGKSKKLLYTAQGISHGVYMLVAQALYNGSKSILDISFERGDGNARIGFVGISKYPIKAGEANTVFACTYGTGGGEIFRNGKLAIELVDQSGNTIQTYTYEGSITGTAAGFEEEFVPRESYEDFTLKATLYSEGAEDDRTEMKYECGKIISGKCTTQEGTSQATDFGLVAAALAIIIALLLVLLLRFPKKKKNIPKYALLFIITLSFSSMPQFAHALAVLP